MTTEPQTTDTNETWATVELMGHGQTAGRISRPSDWGGLLRVDVPEGDTFRTEFYGMTAIYSVKVVSEPIARAYAKPVRSIIAYDTPIVTREQHQTVVARLEQREEQLTDRVRELERRLTAVHALPAPSNTNEDSEGEPSAIE